MRIALVTVNIGGYDEPKSLSPTPSVDYFYFTDNPDYTHPQSHVKTVHVEPSADPVRLSRDIKINTHKYLPEYDYYIYIDGSLSVRTSLAPLLKELNIKANPLCLKKHPRRSTLLQEANRVKEIRKVSDPSIVDMQVEHYKSLGYDVNKQVLFECWIILRANNKLINHAFEKWFEQVELFAPRDQLSIPFIVEKYGLRVKVFNDYILRKYLTQQEHSKSMSANIPPVKQFEPIRGKRPRVHYFTPASGDKNLGKAYNEACALVTDKDDWICIRDGDTMFLTPDWAHQIESIIVNHGNDYGLISCYTNRLGLKWQLLNGQISNDTDILNHTRLAFLLRNKHWDEVVDSPSYTAGLFMLFKRSLWDEIKFEEGLTKTKNNIFVDADFSQTVLKKGKKIGLTKGLYLFHSYRLFSKDPRNYNHLL
jgi:hypothetical protein